METAKKQKILIDILFIAVIAALAYLGLKILSGPLFPFAAAAALTVCIQNFVRKWSKKLKLKKKPASVAAVIIIYILAVTLIALAIYALYNQLTDFLKRLPEYSAGLSVSAQKIYDKIYSLTEYLPDFMKNLFGNMPEATLDTVSNKVADYIAGAVGTFLSGIPFIIFSLAVMVIASAYFAKDYDEISRYITSLIPRSAAKSIHHFKEVMLNKLVAMLKGYFIIAAITFGEVFVGLLVLRVRYALIIALITAVVDLLPVLGSGTVLIPWAVFSALLGNVPRAVGLVVLYLAVTLIRNVIEPKILGSNIGVHPIIMLAAVFIGLWIFGPAGIILVPIVVVCVKCFVESKSNTQKKLKSN